MAAGQIEFIVDYVCDRKVGSAAVVIETVTDVGELLKREGRIVLQPKLNVLVGRELSGLLA